MSETFRESREVITHNNKVKTTKIFAAVGMGSFATFLLPDMAKSLPCHIDRGKAKIEGKEVALF